MTANNVFLALILPLSLSACTAHSDAELSTPTPRPIEATALPAVSSTEVRDLAALEKLRGNAGLTLQWIGWNTRGILEVSQRGKVVHLSGGQTDPNGKGKLKIEGDVLSIDTDSFIFRGRIEMMDTPDLGRSCIKNGDSEFAITQGRQYWRMREFEWCDGLTDYIDIYF